MNYFMLNIVLALTWAMLNGEINPINFIVGFLIGYIILFVTGRTLGPYPYFRKVWKAIRFTVFFLMELVLSNLHLAYDVLTPYQHLMKPRIIAVPLDVKTDAEITTLANLISLTPGTLSLDVSSDRRVLYIHCMYAKDADTARREIKNGMERWVRDLSSKEKE